MLAEHHKDKLSHNPVNVYVEWAKVYLSEEYKSIVDRLKDSVDLLWKGEHYERYGKIFLTASRYEYMFWDMSYRMEKWQV